MSNRGENKICNTKNQEVVKEHGSVKIKNQEDVLRNDGTDHSVDSYATTVPYMGRLPDVLADFDIDEPIVDFEDGEEGRNSHSKNILPGKSHTPTNNSSAPRTTMKYKFGSEVVLNHLSRSLPSSTQLNKKTKNEVQGSKSGHQNSTILSKPRLKGLRAAMAKRDISVFKKQQSRMLNSQVSIIPCTKPSTSKRNNVSKVDLVEERKDIYSVGWTPRNVIYTIDLTKEPPKKKRGLRRNVQSIDEQMSGRHDVRINNAQFPNRDVSQCNRMYREDQNASPYAAIPVVDLLDPTISPKLAALGIRSAVPLSELYSAAGNGKYVLPIVNLDSALNPVACNIEEIGASSFLPLGQLINIASLRKK